MTPSIRARRARLERLGVRYMERALALKRRGKPWAHLSAREQARYRAWLDTLYGGSTDAALRSLATDGASPEAADATAHTDVRGEER